MGGPTAYDRQTALNHRGATRGLEKKTGPFAQTKRDLATWFNYWKTHCHQKCEECGAPVSRFPDYVLVAAQAHILPKSKTSGFPSVAGELDNHMTLPASCGCHSRFDKSWESALSMRIWPVAVERFKTFAHKIPIAEARKLPPVLRDIWDTINQK